VRIQHRLLLQQPLRQLSSDIDPFTAQDGRWIAPFYVGTGIMPVGHAIAVDENEILSRSLPHRFIQDPRFSETDVLLPYVVDRENIMKLFLHLPDHLASLIPAPVIRYQDLRWRHALARKAQQTEFKGLGPVVCRDDRGYFHRMAIADFVKTGYGFPPSAGFVLKGYVVRLKFFTHRLTLDDTGFAAFTFADVRSPKNAVPHGMNS